MQRKSGILLHISSLPGPGGIGTLGKEAYAFADFLHRSGMHIWQVLPMGPTGYGESPYQSTSMYAGNPLFISLETLREEGLVTFTDEEYTLEGDPDHVDYPAARALHERLLRRCFAQSFSTLQSEIEAYRMRAPWVNDFAVCTAVKSHFDQVLWTKWPDEAIRLRKKEAVSKYTEMLKTEIDFHVFCQYLFQKQWFSLKKYCNALQIDLFGDMPIYVAEDSADTWVHPEVFQLDRNRIPKRIAGVPPDYFSADGQKWGNPLYRWPYMHLTGFQWWIGRMQHMLTMYDIVRVDHFIGFANYYSIPYGAPNARIGKWVNSPGKAFFRKLKRVLPQARIIAEDLGSVNARVQRLIDYTGFPGMFVLVFGFGGSAEENHHHPSHWKENSVGYTGTHDNDTVLGYLQRADAQEVDNARKALGFDRIEDGPEAFIRSVMASPCATVVLPMQDILHLDNRARMNLPGTIGGNWAYRMRDTDLTDTLSNHLSNLNRTYGR
ncbi:MAG: 4-alpha-glucanotransferase [Clostridia bacterium]|nr:4-alpha-glucanotransferase [Clostridia bacterium]